MTVPEDHASRVQTINRGFRLLKATISPDSVNTSALAKKAASLHKYQPWKKISDMKKEAYVENCSADLFQIIDVNQQGHITLEQFVGTLAAADLTDEAGVAFAEKAFDLVNGGSKTMTEETFVKFANISCCLRRVGIQLAKFFAFVDVDRSGTIDFDEFDAAREYLGQPALSEAERKNLMALSRCYAPSGQFEFDVTDMTTIVLLDYIKTLIAADTYKRSVSIRSIRTKWRARSTSELSSSH
jgi:Ca2+-binding EF-hand superfamily protein